MSNNFFERFFFEGEERRIIFFSAVKTSGDEKALRFVHCAKRLNTTISRGRYAYEYDRIHSYYFANESFYFDFINFRNLVVVFGNVKALSVSEDWSALINYCKTNESYIEDKNHGQDLAGNDD